MNVVQVDLHLLLKLRTKEVKRTATGGGVARAPSFEPWACTYKRANPPQQQSFRSRSWPSASRGASATILEKWSRSPKARVSELPRASGSLPRKSDR